MDFRFNGVGSHLHTMRAKCRLGFTAKKIEAIPIAGDDLDFQIFCADRLAAVWVPSLSLGGRGRAAQFSFSALTSFGRVYVFYSDMRQQVPKPRPEYEDEGEADAPIVNGDRHALAAMLPRRKPRTDFLPEGAALPVNQLYLPT